MRSKDSVRKKPMVNCNPDHYSSSSDDGLINLTSPVTVSIKRKIRHHYIEIKKDGFHPVELYMTRETAGGYVLCDVLWDLGLISYLLIDRGIGGVYNQKPEVIQANLIPLTEAAPTPMLKPKDQPNNDMEIENRDNDDTNT